MRQIQKGCGNLSKQSFRQVGEQEQKYKTHQVREMTEQEMAHGMLMPSCPRQRDSDFKQGAFMTIA